MSTFVDGVCASQALDSSGEVVDIKGLDISSLTVDGTLNWEHLKDLPMQVIGKIIKAKKIFDAEGCDDERQSYYWNKCQLPFVYIVGELFDDYVESAKHVAGLFKYDFDKRDQNEANVLGFSVEGAKINKIGNVITHSIARKCTVTQLPCNKQAIAEMVPSSESKKDSLDEIFKTEANVEINIVNPKNTSHLLEMLKKEDPAAHAKILGIDPILKSEVQKPKLSIVPKSSTHSIGKTKSGKDVYTHAKVHEYGDFSAQDHRDASTVHHDAAQKSKSARARAHHWDKSRLHQSAANSAMDREQRLKKNEDNSFYHNGDKVRYTGNKEHKHGAEWHEIEHLEGHKKGQKSITSRKPG